MAETKPMTTADLGGKSDNLAADRQMQINPPLKANEQPRRPAVNRVEDPAKADEPVVTVGVPYPSQADLDAIRLGTFRRRREVRPEAPLDYKTR